jgi:hypothetical protein
LPSGAAVLTPITAMMPLADLAPDLVIPDHGSVRSLLRPEFASLCWPLPE